MKKFKVKSDLTEINEHSKKIGYAVLLMTQASNYSLYHLATVKLWLEQPIMHDQIVFFFSLYEVPIGYVTWAQVSDSMSSKFESGEYPILHPSEWNEGNNLWILDFCFPKGFHYEVKNFLKEKFSEDFGSVKWMKRTRFNNVGEYCNVRKYQCYTIQRKR